MPIKIHELADGRFLGYTLQEVTMLPEITAYGPDVKENFQKNSALFSQMMRELYALSSDGSTVAELLWVTQSVRNQPFRSTIRLFFVLRNISADKATVSVSLQQLQTMIGSSLSSAKFTIKQLDAADVEPSAILASVDNSCAFAVVKRDKCSANASSAYPYYYWDIIPGDNADNFEVIVANLSQYENCCLSFQIIPTALKAEELNVLNEATAELGRIAGGMQLGQQMYRDTAAAEPYKALQYFNANARQPLFGFSVLAVGPRPSCAGLAAKVTSLLQSGKTHSTNAEFDCIDVTAECRDMVRQFPHYPWNLYNRLLYAYRNTLLFQQLPVANALFRLPYLVTSDEAKVFFRLPLHEKSMAALRSNQSIPANEQFSDAVVSNSSIQFGTVAVPQGEPISIGCPEKAFTKHALVVGTPGSGKTTFSVNLLLQLARKGIPFLAIEPTKSEYRAMIDTIPDIQIFTPGNNAVSPFIINPFIPPRGIRLEQYTPSLASAFQAAFSMQSPLDMFFLKTIQSCYTEYGWKDHSTCDDDDVTVFGLYEFVRVFMRLVDETEYDPKYKGTLQSAGVLRLTNLMEQNRNIYDTVNTIPVEDILSKPTVLELNSIENPEQKTLLMALLLINICTFIKHNHRDNGSLHNIILIDEAHVLFGSKDTGEGQADSVNTTTRALQNMVAEIRSYGTGIIIADQAPTKVSREVVANTDIKVAFRLVEESERKLLCASVAMQESAAEQLSRLNVGEAFFYFSQLQEPQLIVTPDIREKEGIRLYVPDNEVMQKSNYWDTRKKALIPFNECRLADTCQEDCDFRVRSNAEFFAEKFVREYGEKITDASSLMIGLAGVDKWFLVKQKLDIDSNEPKRLINCTKIRILRKILLHKRLPVPTAGVTMILKKVFGV